ncbi:hypothetical protein V2J09_000850 [Rumex salicifolius]
MGIGRISRATLLCWVFCSLCIKAQSENSSSSVSVRFLQVPPLFSNHKSTTFVFEASEGAASRDTNCSNCSFSCKLDERISSNCEDRNASFSGLQDGYHTFKVCANALQGAGCSSYNWTVDTVPPTAYVTATNSFMNAGNVSVNISFSEPCGFGCLTVNTCNLIVYGSGQVIPQTLTILQPNLTYSVTVTLSSSSLYGRAILIMDKAFCLDAAGNTFTRTENSSFTIHFDRRSAIVSLRNRVPEKLVELNGQTRSVQATNDNNKLKVYLYFSQPIMNTSDEILSSLKVSHGVLQPIQGKSLLDRRFGYVIKDVPKVAVVTVNLVPDMVISKEGNRVSQADPATFLYDSERPGVMLSTTSKMRTKERSMPISIRFTKPVFSFNSAQVSISGGHIQRQITCKPRRFPNSQISREYTMTMNDAILSSLLLFNFSSFREVSRNYYAASVQATDDTISVTILENVTSDVAGNKNLPSNVLQLKHYSKPVESIVIGYFVTASFFVTCFVAGLLTVSTAILQSAGALSRSPSSLTSDPTRNLFRIACYIQVFALSRWLVVNIPVEYYELTACLKWSVPYMNLPWENKNHHIVMFGTPPLSSKLFSTPPDNTQATVVYGAPLTATEYTSFFETQNNIPQAEYIPDPQYLDGWMDFKRSMFWVAIIMGSCILLHLSLLAILKLRDCSLEKRRYGALAIPRFELFLIMLSVPCICKVSVSVIKGGSRLGILVGVVLLILASSVQLAVLVFLSLGITMGKLLQYKEVHQVGRKFHWYQELVRVTLGPGKRGQWTWKDQPNSTKLLRFGPLFEDLRGPPKYMLSQFSSAAAGTGVRRPDRIIASDDETEDAEAPFIQKLFGILRIYYTLLESLKRFSLGVASGLVFFSRSPALTLLCITSFQLFFLLLKKPFIKKKVQLVEIISIACQVGMFATLVEGTKRDIKGAYLLTLFAVGYLGLLMNEWYALWKQIKRLDAEYNGFQSGLKRASAGLLLFLFPKKLIKKFDQKLLETNGSRKSQENATATLEANGGSLGGSRGSSSVDKAWIRQIREMAKSGGFAESSTGNTTRWSRFWSQKRSGSSSMSSSTDYKSKPKSQSQSQSGALYKDMEAIFAASSSGQPAPPPAVAAGQSSSSPS